MKILNIAKALDVFFYENEYQMQVIKSGQVSVIHIKNNIGGEIEFCKVGSAYGVKLDGNEIELTLSEFENLLRPYLGGRIFVSI